MQRLLVHVEGQTEETFVNEVLRIHLVRGFGFADVSARLLGNSRLRSHRGGIRGWDSVSKEVTRHLRQDQVALATTMVDYYGLPESGSGAWPGRAEARNLPFADRAPSVEKRLSTAVADILGENDARRFIPFLVMHEYEGLLFSDPPRFADAIGRPNLADDFQAIRDGFATPEEINDSPQAAPSKRVERLIPEYQKPLMGVQAALDIGLDAIRSQCPHFDAWVSRLEEIGKGSQAASYSP